MDFLAAFADFLDHHALKPRVATTGQAALSLLEARPRHYRLIISDLNLPDMNGVGIAEAAAKLGIPCLILSASTVGSGALPDQLATVIWKMSPPKTILQAISKALGDRRTK